MMSKTASNQGSSSGMADVKYQKAIKQISKLISLNTSLKKQIAGLQETNQKLKLEVQALQQKYNSLQHQCKRNKEEAQKSPAITLSQVSCSHDESGSFVQNLENKRRIQKLQQKIMEKQERINKLKTELDQKITQNKQLYLRNIDLTEQVTKLKTYQNMKGYQAVDNERKKLKRELQKSEEMAKKLSQDYEIMRKQLQFNEKGSINAKSIELDIGMSQSIGQPKDLLSDFYFQKLKKIETENLKLKKQYSEKKQKLKVQIKKLKEQNQNQFGKLMHLTSLMEKQQIFIQKFLK